MAHAPECDGPIYGCPKCRVNGLTIEQMFSHDCGGETVLTRCAICRQLIEDDADAVSVDDTHDAHASCAVQECRDCGETFPFHPDADRCPSCVADLLGGDLADNDLFKCETCQRVLNNDDSVRLDDGHLVCGECS